MPPAKKRPRKLPFPTKLQTISTYEIVDSGLLYPSIHMEPPWPVWAYFHGFGQTALQARQKLRVHRFATERGYSCWIPQAPHRNWGGMQPNRMPRETRCVIGHRMAYVRQIVPHNGEWLWTGFSEGATLAAYLARCFSEQTIGLIQYAGVWPQNPTPQTTKRKFPVLLLHCPGDRFVRSLDVRNCRHQWELRGHEVTVHDTLPKGHTYVREAAEPLIDEWLAAHRLNFRQQAAHLARRRGAAVVPVGGAAGG